MRRQMMFTLLASLATTIWPNSVRADFLTFTSRADWEAAVAGSPLPPEPFFEDFKRLIADISASVT